VRALERESVGSGEKDEADGDRSSVISDQSSVSRIAIGNRAEVQG
jgi:hypothetical protein